MLAVAVQHCDWRAALSLRLAGSISDGVKDVKMCPTGTFLFAQEKMAQAFSASLMGTVVATLHGKQEI